VRVREVLRPGRAEEGELAVVEAAEDRACAEGLEAGEVGAQVAADGGAAADGAVETNCVCAKGDWSAKTVK
jgi:hypothetical protein